MRGSNLVQPTTIFFIGCLVVCVQCGLDANEMVVKQDGRVANTSTDAAVVNSTSVGDSKITVKFCIQNLGCHLSDGYRGTCYCCQKAEVECFRTRSECQDICPTCNPKCQPPPGSLGWNFRLKQIVHR
uniref:Embryo surrounding factor 1 brassicaceae domain-containing protein n=1 Tax=Triticum urartu TaxID=4572 RepID=A0A8R7UHQ4_TRIUA